MVSLIAFEDKIPSDLGTGVGEIFLNRHFCTFQVETWDSIT